MGITEFDPMDYQNESGEWIGFDADMAKAFAESLGVTAEFQVIEWDNKVMELDGKTIDVVWNGMTLTDEVLSAMECSNAYCNNAQVVILPAGVADQYPDAASMAELNFAVETGSAGEAAALGIIASGGGYIELALSQLVINLRYALMADAPRGWNVVFRVQGKQATSAQVEANATENITIDITPSASVQAGSYKIPVRATTSSTSADMELEVVVTGSYDIELTTPRGLMSSDITAGSTKRIDLVIRNTGSAELKDIQLTANKPVDWEVTFDPAKIDKMTAGSTTNVTATVKAASKALPGDYIAKITAKTPEVNTTAEFRLSVHTPMIYGWLGILIIVVVLGGVYYLFRKYGRR